MTKEEKKEYNKRYQQDHKEEIAVRKKRCRQSHKEEIRLYNLKYQKIYHIKIKRKREALKEIISARGRQYRQANKKRIALSMQRYGQMEKGKIAHRKANSKRRAQKAKVVYEIFDAIEVFERDGYRCQHCGKKTRPDYKNPYHPLYPNLDHIKPLSKGGQHSKKNTQCLCHQCNMAKGNNEECEQIRMFG